MGPQSIDYNYWRQPGWSMRFMQSGMNPGYFPNTNSNMWWTPSSVSSCFSNNNNMMLWNTPSTYSSTSSTKDVSYEEYEKGRIATIKNTIQTADNKEREASGLGLTNNETNNVKKIAKKKIEDETSGPSAGEEIACFTTMGAIGAVGTSPIAKSRAYLFGEHNNLFSKATDIYTNTDTSGKTITYNKVYKHNATLIDEAKAAMRKSEMLLNKSKWNSPLNKDLYDRMSSEMKDILKELAKDPKNDQARLKLKNLTAAINETNNARKGYIKRGWNWVKNNTYRKWTGQQSVQLSSPSVQTFETNLTNITATQSTNTVAQGAGQALGKATGVASKATGLVKGVGKFVKSNWLVGVFEAYTDKDKLSAAWKKDTATGLKQTGKTTCKAVGAMAGMALGTKIGAVIGSVVPGAGTIVGSIIGGLAGFAIGGLLSWGGRKLGEACGNLIFGKEDVGANAYAENITKSGSDEQQKLAIETAQWARANREKLTVEERNASDQLDSNLVAAGLLAPEESKVA